MTTQQKPEALRLANYLEEMANELVFTHFTMDMDAAAVELRRLNAENERLTALVEAQQPAQSAAAADPCPGCIPGGYCRTPKCGRLAALNAAPQPSPTPQAGSQPAPAVDDRETFENWARPRGLQLRRNEALGHYSNIDTQRCWEGWTGHADSLHASPSAASIAWNALRDLTDPLGDVGVKIMSHVRIYAQRQYEAGRAARAPADSVTAPAGGAVAGPIYRIRTKNTKHVVWTTVPKHEYLAALEAPEIFECELIATPPAQAADSVLEDAARWQFIEPLIGPGQRTGAWSEFLEEVRKHPDTPEGFRTAVDAARKQGANHD